MRKIGQKQPNRYPVERERDAHTHTHTEREREREREREKERAQCTRMVPGVRADWSVRMVGQARLSE